MTDNRISQSLLVLRFTLGLFLLQWGAEKFVVQGNTPAIWGYFYGIDIPEASAHLFVASIPVLGALFLLRGHDRPLFAKT